MKEITKTEQEQTRPIARPAVVFIVLFLAIAMPAGLYLLSHSGVGGDGSAGVDAAQGPAKPAAVRPPVKPWMPHQNPPEVAAHAAAEVLVKLRTEPENFKLLVEAGNIYMYNRVFGGAIGFYERALRVKEDATLRNDYGNALFYSGNDDAALEQYARVLKDDPKNAQAMFNRGMVLLRAKQDQAAAVASWQELLRTNPRHPRRKQVEQLIAQAKQDSGNPN